MLTGDLTYTLLAFWIPSCNLMFAFAAVIDARKSPELYGTY